MAHILREEPAAVFEYDGEAKALYYRHTHNPVSRTVTIGDRVAVDVDSDGQAIGIEVMDPPGFTMTVTTQAASSDALDFIAKGHLGTPCPRPRDGGMCGCDEDDDTRRRDCLKMRLRPLSYSRVKVPLTC